jgi:hypothetical protein
MRYVSRPLEELDSELERAVFRALYRSREQRWRRIGAGLVLGLRHGARGVLFSWPLYLLAAAGFLAAEPVNILLWSLTVPGIGISLYILARGVREDYRLGVTGRILQPGDLARLLARGAG